MMKSRLIVTNAVPFACRVLHLRRDRLTRCAASLGDRSVQARPLDLGQSGAVSGYFASASTRFAMRTSAAEAATESPA
jgi:hypothetical protein